MGLLLNRFVQACRRMGLASALGLALTPWLLLIPATVLPCARLVALPAELLRESLQERRGFPVLVGQAIRVGLRVLRPGSARNLIRAV